MRISWTGTGGECENGSEKLAVRARRRTCKGGYLESAHRLSEGLVRNAPVHMRRAKFWMVSSRVRWERGRGAAVDRRTVV